MRKTDGTLGKHLYEGVNRGIGGNFLSHLDDSMMGFHHKRFIFKAGQSSTLVVFVPDALLTRRLI